MKIAFPTQENKGKESPVYGHFGSAPFFMVMDTETEQLEVLENKDLHHIHGQCQPLQALGGTKVDAVVVGGIGKGALLKLNGAGIKIYRAVEGSVSDNLELILTEKLPEFSPDQTCAGHSNSGGCAH